MNLAVFSCALITWSGAAFAINTIPQVKGVEAESAPQADSSRGLRPNPILFVTQIPIPADFTNIVSTFGTQNSNMKAAGRGGDLMILYPDGSLRNLTQEAGFGSDGFQGANSIAVRQPTVHFSGTKALFSMVVGAPEEQYQVLEYHWQLYEVSGLAQGQTATITKVPNQPENYNNLSPAYSTFGQILFTSDRPRNGAPHLYPQHDEYESAPTVSGIWSLNPATAELELLTHSPSGAFDISVDSFGRVIFTKWDHLQRDQQSDALYLGYNDNFTFNYTSEAVDSIPTDSDEEFFPEPRTAWIDHVNQTQDYQGPLRGYEPNLVGNTFEKFQPWRINQNGTEEETINHIGRHELDDYFTPSINDDPSIVEFIPEIGVDIHNLDRVRNLFNTRENPTNPGEFFAINAPTFFTHACGQLVSFQGQPALNGDDLLIHYITHPDTSASDPTPSPEHSGLYRNPLPLSNGTLIAAHTTETRVDNNDGTTANPTSRYQLRLKEIDTTAQYAVPGQPLTNGIVKDVQYYDPDTLISYNGPLWELDPVEVMPRPVPPMPVPTLPTQEAAAIANANLTVETVTNYLRDNNLALIVSRDVTTRDRHDQQQPFNLRITNTTTESRGDNGILYDISFMQLFQADQIRGISDDPGRRVLAVPMHDAIDRMPATSGPTGSVRLGNDGSMAALVPAKRAMTWQLTDEQGDPVVRERYWLTFQPGEIRSCTSCHGLNTTDQTGAPPPTNTPQALTDLLTYMKNTGQFACSQADINNDALLDFSDVSAFLIAFSNNEPIADFTDDGIWNFFDISFFLSAFNAGCP